MILIQLRLPLPGQSPVNHLGPNTVTKYGRTLAGQSAIVSLCTGELCLSNGRSLSGSLKDYKRHLAAPLTHQLK